MDEYPNSARQHRSFAQYVETRDVNNKTERRIEFAEIPFIHSSGGGGEWSLASDRSACRLHVAIMCLPLLERTLVSLTDKPCLIHSTILFYAYYYWQLILVPLLLTTPPWTTAPPRRPATVQPVSKPLFGDGCVCTQSKHRQWHPTWCYVKKICWISLLTGWPSSWHAPWPIYGQLT